jgi:outer membrane scaffolding protein for murein synthesis (MipA/OmpV family)
MTKRALPRSKDLLRISPWLLSASLMVATSQATAQDFDDEDASDGKWEIVLGAGALYEPTFEGAKDHETSALPYFSITYDDTYSFGVEGLSAKLYDGEALGLTAKIGYDFGREEADDPHLAGLGDIEGGATLGFSVDYEAGPLELYADLERSFGDGDGVVGKFGAEVSRPVGQVLLGANLSATWADDNHMQNYFGVTAGQSASSGLATYEAGAGFKRVDLELSAAYMLSENWMLQGQIGIGELVGDAADSPIVQDTTQISAGIFVAYTF